MGVQIEIGTYCFFKGKYDHGFPCKIVAYDGAVAVVKRLSGGYRGVKPHALEPTTRELAFRAAHERAEKIK
ncbi:hypothetical protein [Pantoea agglomerans]|uniref:Uncharacterized protein n=1 Tax=Enterobacter agglomerans TaxID=549 RepID=A0ACC5RHH8_ENTAG|nr:hypothetical protein [Pantoea agglomerans]MBK4723945.1 hypothetical protein [Pantoea agglomerans]